METAAQKHTPRQTAGGQGSFDDISPELPQKKPLLLQVRGEELEEEVSGPTEEAVGVRRRIRGAHSLPPHLLIPTLQGRGIPPQLKGLREAPTLRQVEVEGGGAKALWRAVFSGNRREKKKWGRTLPPGAEMVNKDAANQRRAPGDDVIKKQLKDRVRS